MAQQEAYIVFHADTGQLVREVRDALNSAVGSADAELERRVTSVAKSAFEGQRDSIKKLNEEISDERQRISADVKKNTDELTVAAMKMRAMDARLQTMQNSIDAMISDANARIASLRQQVVNTVASGAVDSVKGKEALSKQVEKEVSIIEQDIESLQNTTNSVFSKMAQAAKSSDFFQELSNIKIDADLDSLQQQIQKVSSGLGLATDKVEAFFEQFSKIQRLQNIGSGSIDSLITKSTPIKYLHLDEKEVKERLARREPYAQILADELKATMAPYEAQAQAAQELLQYQEDLRRQLQEKGLEIDEAIDADRDFHDLDAEYNNIKNELAKVEQKLVEQTQSFAGQVDDVVAEHLAIIRAKATALGKWEELQKIVGQDLFNMAYNSEAIGVNLSDQTDIQKKFIASLDSLQQSLTQVTNQEQELADASKEATEATADQSKTAKKTTASGGNINLAVNVEKAGPVVLEQVKQVVDYVNHQTAQIPITLHIADVTGEDIGKVFSHFFVNRRGKDKQVDKVIQLDTGLSERLGAYFNGLSPSTITQLSDSIAESNDLKRWTEVQKTFYALHDPVTGIIDKTAQNFEAQAKYFFEAYKRYKEAFGSRSFQDLLTIDPHADFAYDETGLPIPDSLDPSGWKRVTDPIKIDNTTVDLLNKLYSSFGSKSVQAPTQAFEGFHETLVDISNKLSEIVEKLHELNTSPLTISFSDQWDKFAESITKVQLALSKDLVQNSVNVNFGEQWNQFAEAIQQVQKALSDFVDIYKVVNNIAPSIALKELWDTISKHSSTLLNDKGKLNKTDSHYEQNYKRLLDLYDTYHRGGGQNSLRDLPGFGFMQSGGLEKAYYHRYYGGSDGGVRTAIIEQEAKKADQQFADFSLQLNAIGVQVNDITKSIESLQTLLSTAPTGTQTFFNQLSDQLKAINLLLLAVTSNIGKATQKIVKRETGPSSATQSKRLKEFTDDIALLRGRGGHPLSLTGSALLSLDNERRYRPQDFNKRFPGLSQGGVQAVHSLLDQYAEINKNWGHLDWEGFYQGAYDKDAEQLDLFKKSHKEVLELQKAVIQLSKAIDDNLYSKYANKSGILVGNFLGTDTDTRAELEKIVADRAEALEVGEQLTGKFVGADKWVGELVQVDGAVVGITYSLDKVNHQFRELETDSAKSTEKVQEGMAKANKSVRDLYEVFRYYQQKRIGGHVVTDLSGLDELVTDKGLEELNKFRALQQQISDLWDNGNLVKLAEQRARGVKSDYTALDRFTELIKRYSSAYKELNKILGLTGAAWKKTQRGVIRGSVSSVSPMGIQDALENELNTYLSEQENRQLQGTKLNKAGTELTATILGEDDAIHKVVLSYDEYNQAVRLSTEVDEKATELRRKNLGRDWQTISSSLSMMKEETIENSFGLPKITDDVKNIEEVQEALRQLAEKREEVLALFQSRTDWEEIASARSNGGAINEKDIQDLERLRQLVIEYNNLRNEAKQSTADLVGSEKELKQISSYTASFRDFYHGFVRAYAVLTPFKKVMDTISSSFTGGYEALSNYDKALTNISYTMNLTKNQLQDLGKANIQMAKDLNISVENAMAISQIYSNLQTTAEEIVNVAKPTAILSNLSGQSAETAANYIQSVMMQFDKTEDEVMHIVDVYDTISANIKVDYAKGIGIIAGGVQAAGQVAHDAGLSFEQLAAITAKVAERTREEGSAIGNSLKTIITRLSKASKLSGADEVDNETLSAASKALADVGVRVYESTGEFRNLADILGELAAVWDSLTDVQRNNISYQVAATRQSNKFKAILIAFKDAMQLAEEATVGQNTALQNQEKYADSLAGKTQELKTSVEALWINLYNSEGLKGIVSGVTNVVDDINKQVAKGFDMTWPGLFTSAVIGAFTFALRILPHNAAMQQFGEKMANMVFGSTFKKAGADAINDGLTEMAGRAGLAAAGLGAVIAAGIVVAIVHGIRKAAENKELRKKGAVDAFEDYQESSKNLQQYIEKVKEYKTIIDDTESTEAQVYQAKKDLYDIQTQLTAAYGDSAKNLDLLNDAMDASIQKMLRMDRAQVQAWGTQIQYSKGTWGDLTAESNVQIATAAEDRLREAWGEQPISVSVTQIKIDDGVKDALQQAFDEAGLTLTEEWIEGDGKNDKQRSGLTITSPGLTRAQAETSYEQAISALNKLLVQNSPDSAIYKAADYFLKEINPIFDGLRQANDADRQLVQMLQQYRLTETSATRDYGYRSDYDFYRDYAEALDDYAEALVKGEGVEEAQAEYSRLQGIADSVLASGQWSNVATLFADAFEVRVGGLEAYRQNQLDQIINSKAPGWLRLIQQSGLSDIDLRTLSYTDSRYGAANIAMQHFQEAAQEAGYSAEESFEAVLNYLTKSGALTHDIVEDTQKIITIIPNTQAVTVASLAELDSAVDKIGSLFKSLEDENGTGFLSGSDIQSLRDTFGGENGLQDIDEWMRKLGEVQGNVKATEEIINEMVSNWLSENEALQKASLEDAKIVDEAVAGMRGTYNDLNAVQQATVREAVNGFAEESGALEVATEADIANLVALANQLGLTTEAERAYFVQKLVDAGVLDTSGDISALAAVCEALGVATNAWANYYRARSDLETLGSVDLSSYDDRTQMRALAVRYGVDTLGLLKEYGSSEADTKIREATEAAITNYIDDYGKNNQQVIEQALQDLSNTATGVTFTGVADASKSGGGGGSDHESEPEAINWMERHIDLLEREHELQEKIANDEDKIYSKRREAIAGEIAFDQERLASVQQAAKTWKELYEKTLPNVLGMTDVEGKNPITRELIEGMANGSAELVATRYSKDNYDKLKDVIEYYDKAVELEQEEFDLNEELFDHKREQYQMEIEKLSTLLSLQEANNTNIENQISLYQTEGRIFADATYQELIDNAQAQIDLYEDQIAKHREWLGELETDSAEYLSVKNSIAECENAIIQVKTQQAEWNETLKKLPIERLEYFLQVLDTIKSDFDNFFNEQEASGKKTTSAFYTEQISLAEEEIERLNEQYTKYTSLLRSYDYGSEKWQETHDAMQEIQNDLSSIRVNLLEWNETIAKMPIDNIEAFRTTLSGIQTDIQNYITANQTAGKLVAAGAYESLINLAGMDMERLLQQRAEWVTIMSNYDWGSEKYQEAESAIRAIDDALADNNAKIFEWNDALRQIPIDIMDKYVAVLSNVVDVNEAWITQQASLGRNVSSDAYMRMMELSADRLEKLNEQRAIWADRMSDYDFGTDKWQEAYNSLSSIDGTARGIVDKMIEWNEQVKRIPIERIERYMTLFKNIQQILTDYLDQQEARGSEIPIEVYEKMIELEKTEAAVLKVQRMEYQRQLESYEYGTEKYNEIADAVQNVDVQLTEVVKTTIEWAKAILAIPTAKITEFNEEIKAVASALNEVRADYDTVISAVSEGIDRETEAIQKQRDETEKSYEERIKEIQDVIDALEEENELRDKRNAIDSAEYDLERARTQESIAIIQNGRKEFIADEDAIREAQEQLDQANYDYQIYQLQQQIEDLEEERDQLLEDYDIRIDKLSEIANKWSEITKNIQFAKDSLMADEFLGDNWLAKVINGEDDDLYEMFKGMYEAIDSNITTYEDVSDTNDKLLGLMQQYIDEYIAGNLSYSEATTAINGMSDLLGSQLSATELLNLTLQSVIDRNNALFPDATGSESITSVLQALSNGIDGVDFDSYFTTAESALVLAAANSDSLANTLNTVDSRLAELNNTLSLNFTEEHSDADTMAALLADYIVSWRTLSSQTDATLTQLALDYQTATSATHLDWEILKAKINNQIQILENQYAKADESSKALQDMIKQIEAEREELRTNQENLEKAVKSGSNVITSTLEKHGGSIASSVKKISDWTDKYAGPGASGKDADYVRNHRDEFIHHSGIETGYISASDDAKLEALKKMSLSPLKPDEVPALLQAGEVVLNRPQQNNLLNNIRNLAANQFGIGVGRTGTIVNLTMSNLTFHEIQNGQDFANYIAKNLSAAIAQQVG